MSSPERKVRFGSAVRWATVMSWGQDGLAAVATFVLALILGPKDFGLVAIALSYVGVFELCAAQGLVTAVVQTHEMDDADLDSIFWYAVACGAVLALGAAASGPAMAAFFGIAQLEPIVQVLAIGILIRALTVVHEAKLIREMNFKSLATRMNIATVLSIVAGVSLALLGYGVWALVAQWLTKVTATLVGLWGAAGWSPRFRARSARGGALISFSWKTFPATILDYATSQTEPIVMGKLFGEVAVGIYRIATRVIELVITIVTRALWHVSFPYLAEAKGDEAVLRERIGSCLRYSLLFCVPIVALMGLESPALILLMGEEWKEVVPVIRVLSVYAVIRAMILFNGPLLLARSRPRTFSVVVAVQCVATILGVVVVSLFLRNAPLNEQLPGIAWARIAAYSVVSIPTLGYLVFVSVRMPVVEVRAVITPALLVALPAFALDLLLIWAGHAMGVPPVASFFARVVIVGSATAALLLSADRSVRDAVLGRLRAIRRPSAAAVKE